MTKPPPRPSQAELVETSLRNVRELVDKIEAEEAAERHSQKRMIGIIVACVVALLVVVVVLVFRKPATKEMIVAPETSAAAKAKAAPK